MLVVEEQADMIRNILPAGVEWHLKAMTTWPWTCSFMCERAVGNDAFAVLLADDFLTDYFPGVTSDLIRAYELSGKSQLSVMKVDGPDISKYGVIVPNAEGKSIIGLIEKPNIADAPSNLASIGRYVLTPDIFEILRELSNGAEGEIQLADAINIQAVNNVVDTVKLKGRRFDCGSVNGFLEATNFEFKKLAEF